MRLSVPTESGRSYTTEIAAELSSQAELLLTVIARRSLDIADTMQVRLDWGVVKLVPNGAEIAVEEPDYRHDPLIFVRRLDFTCAVLREQQRVHDSLNVSAEPVTYDQYVLEYPESLTAERLVATRRPPNDSTDSGWRVFDERRIDWNAPPMSRRVFEIARARPALLAVLSLPAGWSVQLHADTLAECAAPQGERTQVGLTIRV